jgi:hypothetical protein
MPMAMCRVALTGIARRLSPRRSVHDDGVGDAELLIQVEVEPEFGQVQLSAGRHGPYEPGYFAEPGHGGEPAVSGTGTILVSTWSDDNDPVAVSVYRGRPPLAGWTHVHTAHILVQDDGLTVGMTVSAIDYPVPASAGTAPIEVWVRPLGWASAVTFVLEPNG